MVSPLPVPASSIVRAIPSAPRRRGRLMGSTAIFAALAFLANPAVAQDFEWTGVQDANWDTAGNWQPLSGFPDGSDNSATLPGGASNTAIDLGGSTITLEALTIDDFRPSRIQLVDPMPIPEDELRRTYQWMRSWDMLDDVGEESLIDAILQSQAHGAAGE